MALSSALSVATFSVVLAESCAAVGISSLTPVVAVTLARLVKEIAKIPANATGADGAKRTALVGQKSELEKFLNLAPGGSETVTNVLHAISAAVETLDILQPNKAKIHAEFAFESMENYSGSVSGGGSASVESIGAVGIAAGFAMMYEAKSSNRITLDLEFAPVHYIL